MSLLIPLSIPDVGGVPSRCREVPRQHVHAHMNPRISTGKPGEDLGLPNALINKLDPRLFEPSEQCAILCSGDF
jgi:hypothetical protein